MSFGKIPTLSFQINVQTSPLEPANLSDGFQTIFQQKNDQSSILKPEYLKGRSITFSKDF